MSRTFVRHLASADARLFSRFCRAVLTAAMLLVIAASAPAPAVELASLDPATARPSGAVSAPLVRETYETYDVKGTCIPELRSELRRCGVKMNDGHVYDARTSWDIRWEYGHRHTADSCSLDRYQVIVDVTIRFPTWATDTAVSADLADSWDTYLHSLIRHEHGHRDIAVANAKALTRAVAALPAAASCADLDRNVESLGRDFMKRHARAQRSYDAKTDHGAWQGAVLLEP